jgi:hypothetical protein
MVSNDQLRRPRARWLLPTVLVVVAVAAAAGVLARDLYQRPLQTGAGEVVSSSGGPSTVPRSEQPGERVVRLSVDAGLHPDGERVRILLQQHFDAINGHKYQQWRETVTSERVRRVPEAKWQSDYQTTTDGTIFVHRIEASSTERLRVMISFVSLQDVSKAPAELQSDCIKWRVVYPMQEEAGALRVDIGPEGTASQFEAC